MPNKKWIVITTVVYIGIFFSYVSADWGLKVGDKALDFTLKYLHSKNTFTLSSNRGKKPTVLIFGSYT